MGKPERDTRPIEEQFKNPDMSFRGLPFWGWNCDLDHERLAKQIKEMKEMGFGGVTIHPREGMRVPYLQDEYMDAVRFSVEEAKKEGMQVWLYDEERWPSGNAGGYVTQNPAFRKKYIRFTQNRQADIPALAVYTIRLNEKGELDDYCRGEEDGTHWWVYEETEGLARRYNGYTHVDSMNPGAVDRFIELTHEKYKEAVGEEFSETVTAMFTDEPQMQQKGTLADPFSSEDVKLSWTDDFPETFLAEYGADILSYLPELLWELPGGAASQNRYRYHNHICDRFMENFCGKCEDWCQENRLPLTGHFLHEETLFMQSRVTGDVMRGYVHFHIPGMDILRNAVEFGTAKQVQSVVHQYGYERMMSEMYALTNWDFDFRGQKFQSDWQSALGVNVRVPSIVQESLKGYAKRDFPPFLGSHSPWYREYRYIEDHFARVYTAMTRGKQVIRIGMIHPIESYWLHWGPDSQTKAIRDKKDQEFADVMNWLLFGCLDFDFINEALLADGADNVWDMEYDVILVPNCETLRGTTASFLEESISSGKQVVFLGDKPKYLDVKPYEEELCKGAQVIPFEESALLDALEPYREIRILADGHKNETLIYGLRKEEDESRWLFLAHGRMPKNRDNEKSQQLEVWIKGQYAPELYDTISGEVKKISYVYRDGMTRIPCEMYDFESLLFRLKPTDAVGYTEKKTDKELVSRITFPEEVSCRREEPNVLLLDLAEYRFLRDTFEGPDEIQRIDEVCRRRAKLVPAGYKIMQPWCFRGADGEPVGCVELKFHIASTCQLEGTRLAFEEASRITLNGEEVPVKFSGWYVDQDIHTVELPKLMAGTNILCVEVPIGNRDSLESMYLLGEFSVQLKETDCFAAETRKSMITAVTTGQAMGTVLGDLTFADDPEAEEVVKLTGPGHIPVLSEAKSRICFGTVTDQGLPFYSGNLVYETKVEAEEDCEAIITVPAYRGALVKIVLDGKDSGVIVHGPYQAFVHLEKGSHIIGIRLYGNRNNTFGSFHNCNPTDIYYGPSHWLARGKSWTYRYLLKDMGIMKAPVIELLR